MRKLEITPRTVVREDRRGRRWHWWLSSHK